MGGLFGGTPKPKAPPPPPKKEDPEIQRMADAARKRALLAKGRESTILTAGGSNGLGFVG